MGSFRVRAVTVFVVSPRIPSGSVITKRHSYSVSGSRFRMLPENMLGTTQSNGNRGSKGLSLACGGPPITHSRCRRSSGRAFFHCVSPFFLYETSTAALRLSSPVIFQSKPSDNSVGGSTENSPATVVVCACARTDKPNNKAASAITLLRIICGLPHGRIWGQTPNLTRYLSQNSI